MYDVCSICLYRIHWYQDWIGTKRYLHYMWVERAHYKCWKKDQQDARATGKKVDVSGVDDVFSLREPEPRG